MELSPDHVVLPREDYLELQEAAMLAPAQSGKERVQSVIQTTLVLAAVSGSATAIVWGWVKARDWLEERNFQRKIRSGEIHVRTVE